MKHHTKTLGDLGIFKAQLDLYQKGYVVCNPMTEHAPFDLIIFKDGICKTVQVKTRNVNSLGQVVINFYNSYSDSRGVHTSDVNKEYIDLYCIYVPQTDKCYYLNPKLYGKSISIRVNPLKNKQEKNINFIDDFLILPE